MRAPSANPPALPRLRQDGTYVEAPGIGGDEVRHRIVGAVVDDDQVVHRAALAGQGAEQGPRSSRRRQVTTIATTEPGARR